MPAKAEKSSAVCDPTVSRILQDLRTLSEKQAASTVANAALGVASANAYDAQWSSWRNEGDADQPSETLQSGRGQQLAEFAPQVIYQGVIHGHPAHYQTEQPQARVAPGPAPATQLSLADTVLESVEPIDLVNAEPVSVLGQSGLLVNQTDLATFQGTIPLSEYPINEDPNPDIIQKHTNQQLLYTQEIAIRYLRPPTPPPPGDIIIRQEKNIPISPAPPIVLRQQPPRPETPPPLVVREAPPKPPVQIRQKLVTISGKRLAPPPRKVIIERLAPLPSKPQSIIIERWLPYSEPKRRVIYQKSTEADIVYPKPHNVIIQWDAPTVAVRKEFRDLGVIRANPAEYVERFGSTLKQASELPDFVKEIRPPPGVVLAADSRPAVAQLEGDLAALSLIDLQSEGLAEYIGLKQPVSLYYASSSLPAQKASQPLWPESYESKLQTCDVCQKAKVLYEPAQQALFSVEARAEKSLPAERLQQTWPQSSLTSQTASLAGAEQSSETIHEIFNMIDQDDNGYVTVDEARAALVKCNQQLGRGYSEADLQKFMDALDKNNDNKIDYAELKKAWLASCPK